MTKEQLEEYNKNHTCPYCKCERIYDINYTKTQWRCLKCDKKWQEIYEVVEIKEI